MRPEPGGGNSGRQRPGASRVPAGELEQEVDRSDQQQEEEDGSGCVEVYGQVGLEEHGHGGGTRGQTEAEKDADQEPAPSERYLLQLRSCPVRRIHKSRVVGGDLATLAHALRQTEPMPESTAPGCGMEIAP